MKTKLIVIFTGFAVSVSAQYFLIDGKVHNYGDGTFQQLTGSYYVTDIRGRDVICQPFQVITTKFATTHLKSHGVGSSDQIVYEGNEVVFRNLTGVTVGSPIPPKPLWAVPVGSMRIEISNNDLRLRPIRQSFVPYQEGRRLQDVSVYDFGIPYTPPPKPLTPAQIEARKEAAAKSLEQVKSQAEAGSSSSQYSLGIRYLTGYGCETNRDEAIRWLKLAASAGNTEASNKLAQLNP